MRFTCIPIGLETDRLMDRKTDRQSVRQIGRRIDRRTGILMDRNISKWDRQTQEWADGQTDKEKKTYEHQQVGK
jgi:hypothetical protein